MRELGNDEVTKRGEFQPQCLSGYSGRRLSSRFVLLVAITSLFFLMLHGVSTFYALYLSSQHPPANKSTSESSLLSTDAKESVTEALQVKCVQINNETKDNETATHNGNWSDYDDGYEIDRKRAIVLISMGEEASNTSMVERFVWSARNIGNYTGWIILITDADEHRYANLEVAAKPKDSIANSSRSLKYYRVKKRREDQNERNHFLVFRTQEQRFSRITFFKKFHSENTMNSKIFKTYILKYVYQDFRLNAVELFYYLDVDIVFGNSIRPLFAELEQRYSIRSQQRPPQESGGAIIYFFRGNNDLEIQGGQFVLDRKRSQPCLDRWRQLMQLQRNIVNLKDQTQLIIMLEEQRLRARAKNTTKKDCEIVLMDQNKTLIQFPEAYNIKNHHPHEKKHATLIHFRNSAKVMRKIDEENFELYMREILRFDKDQKDELGILSKMTMKVDRKRYSGQQQQKALSRKNNSHEPKSPPELQLAQSPPHQTY